jgi:hypothetical protein
MQSESGSLNTRPKFNAYFRALETLMEAILERSGTTPEGGPKEALGEKLKRWFSQFGFAALEKEAIDGYGKKLANAMDQFRVRIFAQDMTLPNNFDSSHSRFSWVSRCIISRAR